MKANYKIEAGDVRVIRPLCYAREALTKDFARTNRLPIVNENCPACFEEPKERHRVKKARNRKRENRKNQRSTSLLRKRDCVLHFDTSRVGALFFPAVPSSQF